MNNLRPIQHLKNILGHHPNLSEMVDFFRAERGRDLPKWPNWCFLPMAAWHAIACAKYDGSDAMVRAVSDMPVLSAIGAWRYSQGIYQIDNDLMAALKDTAISGDLPSEVLYRLPEWSIYIETPGYHWQSDLLHGFWVHLEWDVHTERTELRFLLDCDKGLKGVPLHIGDWPVIEAVDRVVQEASQNTGLISRLTGRNSVQSMAENIRPLLSVLMYICSESPEIDDAREPGSFPARAAPKKTKKGWQLFPPKKPRLWTVGASMGERLRGAETTPDGGNRDGVAPHLRRGHWHGYWTGPRKDKTGAPLPQKFIYKWLPPMVVGE